MSSVRSGFNLTEKSGNEQRQGTTVKLRALLEKFETWYYHKQALRFMRKRYKAELASHRISETYLTELIIDYPGEDGKKAKLRNDLVTTQGTIKNLELLLAFLGKAK